MLRRERYREVEKERDSRGENERFYERGSLGKRERERGEGAA